MKCAFSHFFPQIHLNTNRQSSVRCPKVLTRNTIKLSRMYLHITPYTKLSATKKYRSQLSAKVEAHKSISQQDLIIFQKGKMKQNEGYLDSKLTTAKRTMVIFSQKKRKRKWL